MENLVLGYYLWYETCLLSTYLFLVTWEFCSYIQCASVNSNSSSIPLSLVPPNFKCSLSFPTHGFHSALLTHILTERQLLNLGPHLWRGPIACLFPAISCQCPRIGVGHHNHFLAPCGFSVARFCAGSYAPFQLLSSSVHLTALLCPEGTASLYSSTH